MDVLDNRANYKSSILSISNSKTDAILAAITCEMLKDILLSSVTKVALCCT